MFDTPDLWPLCIAPWIGLGVGLLVYLLTTFVTRKKPNHKEKVPLFFSIIIGIIITFASVNLRIGELDPTPWFTPSQKDIVGIWYLEKNIIDLLDEQGYRVPKHSLEFKDDGTFEMNNLPNLWITLSDASPGDQTEFNAYGTWTISDKGSIYAKKPIYVVFLSFDSLGIGNIDLSDTPVYTEGKIPLYFREHLPPYKLDARGFGKYNPIMRFVRE